jgi:hypothetical protein
MVRLHHLKVVAAVTGVLAMIGLPSAMAAGSCPSDATKASRALFPDTSIAKRLGIGRGSVYRLASR